MKFKPGDYVRIRTFQEIIKENKRIQGERVIIDFENCICEVQAARLVPPVWHYKLKLVSNWNNGKYVPEMPVHCWWYEYELEEYEMHEIADEAYEALIGGVQ